MLTLLLVPLAGLHFCVGLDFVTPYHCNLFKVYIITSSSGAMGRYAKITEINSNNITYNPNSQTQELSGMYIMDI
jgi:hypothetical protein